MRLASAQNLSDRQQEWGGMVLLRASCVRGAFLFQSSTISFAVFIRSFLRRAAAVAQRAYGWRQRLHGTDHVVAHAVFRRSFLRRAAAVAQGAYGWRQRLHGTEDVVAHAVFRRSFLRRNA